MNESILIQNNLNEKKIKKELSIDEKLNYIKEFKFNKEKIKREINIDLEIIAFYNEKRAVIKLDNIFYEFESPSRIIEFKNGELITKIFVLNNFHLKKVIEDLKFQPFSYYNADNSSDPFRIVNNSPYAQRVLRGPARRSGKDK